MDSRSDREARIEQMMADIRRMTQTIEDVQKKYLQMTATVTSDDGMITATVGPRGHLVELEIDPRVYRRPNSAQLAMTIVETTRRAVEEVGEEVAKLYANFAPEEFGAEKMLSGTGMPKDLLRLHDAELMKSGEAQDEH